MEDTEERWSPEQVLALAPDAASRKAGTKLGVPGPWSGVGLSLEDGDAAPTVWGLCAGSGGSAYRTVIGVAPSPVFKCTCPSRKFPCKHVLGLLLLWAGSGVAASAPTRDVPEWVRQWRAARRGAAARRGSETTDRAAAGPADPKAALRRAERRARRVRDGAEELRWRLTDRVRSGLAAHGQGDDRTWEEVAARMVDAQAPGLATRTRELAAMAGSGDDWPSRLLEEHALLHLLARGYLAHDGLPRGLAATVRSRVGFTTGTDELLAGPTVRDSWLVLAQRDSVEGRLTTRRIWLHGSGSGRAALLLSFGAAGRSPELWLRPGSSLDAEVAYHPGALALRAVLGVRHGECADGLIPPGVTVDQALDSYGRALCADPWLEEYPVVLDSVIPVPTADGWQLADAAGGAALPVDPRRLGRPGLWRMAAVSGGAALTVFGSLGHRGFTPLTTWSNDAAEPSSMVTL